MRVHCTCHFYYREYDHDTGGAFLLCLPVYARLKGEAYVRYLFAVPETVVRAFDDPIDLGRRDATSLLQAKP